MKYLFLNNLLYISLTLYIIISSLYYFYYSIFPYRNISKWIALLELFLIILLEYYSNLSISIGISLKYLQIILLSFSFIYYENKIKEYYKFIIFYFLFLIFSFFLYILKGNNIIFFILFSTTALVLFTLPIYFFQKNKHVVNNNLNFLLYYLIEKREYLQTQKILFKELFYIFKDLNKLSLDDLNLFKKKEIYFKKAYLLLILENNILTPKNKLLNNEIINNLEEYLSNIFKEVNIIKNNSKIKLNIKNNIKINNIEFSSLWKIMILWLFEYFLTNGRAQQELNIYINKNNILNKNNNFLEILIKIESKLNIKENKYSNKVKCPLCLKSINQIYVFHNKNLGICRECMEKKVINLINTDWDLSKPNLNNEFFWLLNKIIKENQLGNIRYKIEDLKKWKISITLRIKVNLYEKVF